MGLALAIPGSLGVASHLGLLLDIPTIGVAKSILVGEASGTLEKAGAEVPLVWKRAIIGTVLRTKKNCSPLFVSPGHKMSFASAVEFVMRSLKGYRLPEPT